MFSGARGLVVVAAMAALVAACAGPREEASIRPPSPSAAYKIGQPYQIDGTWYYPSEQPDYDETGVASWYGPTFYGKYTANGESYDSSALTAAHRTLPMPVNVRVTNLENGRSLVLRVNDRGPFARGRIIDVSEKAAQLLGFYETGTAKVRVTFVSRAALPGGAMPDDTAPAIARALPAAPTAKVQMAALDPVIGTAVLPAPSTPAVIPAAQSPSPASLDSQPTGQVTEVPVPAVTHIYVQAGAFSVYGNALRQRDRLASAGNLTISPIDRNGRRLYRVRIGPFDDVNAADAALASLLALGNSDAKIIVDQ
jgi:rare lipoprotein A